MIASEIRMVLMLAVFLFPVRPILSTAWRLRAGARASSAIPQLLAWLCVLASFGPGSLTAGAYTNGMVVSVHPLATEAGLNILKSGGNAIDATVAMALTLGVVDSENSGIGGGCFILIRLANGEVVAVDGRETAPAGATRDMFVRNGKAQPELSQTGALASGVPGALAAYEFATSHYGRKQLRELLLPAAKLAEDGFSVDKAYAECLKSVAGEMGRFASSHAVFFNGRRPLKQGELLRQPELARTYRHIAEQGIEWFYRGEFATATADWMRANGGLLTARDFADYQVKLREPITSTYRGFKLLGFPPPSSGGIHVAQILNALENFELKSLDEGARLHIIAEAMKLAFADRAFWLGDSDFAKVPLGLTDKSYARALAAQINREHASAVRSHGMPPDWRTSVFKKHTTHFSAADAQGNWVACTATINTSFGSKVVIPGTGVLLNNQMDDFSIQPGVTNAFGLIGAEANSIAPGKRPLSSMSPTLVVKDGKPILALGAAGGPKIISQVLLELVCLLDLGMSPRQALEQPRIHHQWFPDRLMVEPSLPRAVREQLRRRGHQLESDRSMGVSHIVAFDAESEGFVGAADPRAGGSAEGW